MSYVPPHKRHSNDPGKAPAVPESFVPKFKKNLNLRESKTNVVKGGKIIYAQHAVSRWFLSGSKNSEDEIPQSVHLVPVSLESVERRSGEKPLRLVNNGLEKENNEVRENDPRSPWVVVAEKVKQDLLSAFELVKNEMASQELDEVKPNFVARFGKILIHGSPSVSLESLKDSQVTENILRKLKKSFYTDIPNSYIGSLKDGVVPRIELHLEEEKDIYRVKLSDKTHADATISCKCTSKDGNRLNMYKAELNQVRQLVVDVSCLDKNLDLRLMLCSKRILKALTDDEMNNIKELIDSAVIDPNVKGGLRWPVGKASSGERFSVCGVWHTVTTAYSSPMLRLRIRKADRFDFTTATGEVTREVILTFKGIVSKLQEQKVEDNSVSDMLKDALRTIWDHFLSCESFLT